jgi:hypothetical protein
MSTDPSSTEHLTSTELAGYLDGRLDATSSLRLESHLASCADCRAEMADVRALLASPEAERAAATGLPRRARARTWLAAAAVVAIAGVPLLQRFVAPREQAPAVRAAPTRQAVIDVIAPREGSADGAAVVFTWHAVQDATTYRLTVTDSSGAPLLTRATTDTTVSAPAERTLVRGRVYLWYVDGLRRDGRTSSSGIHSFSMAR